MNYYTRKILTILFEWLLAAGEGIMNLAQKVLTVLNNAGGQTPAEAYAAIVESYNPLFYWKFNEASGTTAINYGSVGTGANCTYSASDIAGQAVGPFGGPAARMVEADSNYIDIGTGGAAESNWPANELSIFGWVRSYSGDFADANQHFFFNVSGSTDFIWMQKIAVANNFNQRYQAAGTTKTNNVTLSPAPGTGWVMLGMTISLSNNRVRMYYNSNEVDVASALPTWGATAWTLARFGTNGAAFGDFDYAHWAVFNSELDSATVTALYNGGPI